MSQERRKRQSDRKKTDTQVKKATGALSNQENLNTEAYIISVVKWLIICVGISLFPLLLSIGIVIIADFGWKNVDLYKIVPDYLLIAFTISVNVFYIAIEAENQKMKSKAHLHGILAFVMGCASCGLYFGLFSPKMEEYTYGIGTIVVLLVISTFFIIVNAFFGADITKWENMEDAEKKNQQK